MPGTWGIQQYFMHEIAEPGKIILSEKSESF
jgi:hypothetical protein